MQPRSNANLQAVNLFPFPALIVVLQDFSFSRQSELSEIILEINNLRGFGRLTMFALGIFRALDLPAHE
jgi:hypothetical protein